MLSLYSRRTEKERRPNRNCDPSEFDKRFIDLYPTLDSSDQAIDRWLEIDYREFQEEYWQYISQYDDGQEE